MDSSPSGVFCVTTDFDCVIKLFKAVIKAALSDHSCYKTPVPA